MHHHHGDTQNREAFPTSTEGLPEAAPPRVIDLADGETTELRIGAVTKQIGDERVRMLAYSGSIPGPTLRVREGSRLIVDVQNDGDLEATVHWHGLRLDNRYDGTHETQAPMPVGGSFSYRLDFPDPGIYWYHPHIRQDYGQEMGLYGNIIVVPTDDGLLATGAPRDRTDARRRADRGRQGRVVRRERDQLLGDGPVRKHHAHRRRDRPRTHAHDATRSFAST